MANEQNVVTICTYAVVKKGQSTDSMHYCPHAGPFCKPENANVHVQVEGRKVFVCPKCKAQLQAGAKLKWEWPETPDQPPRAAKQVIVHPLPTWGIAKGDGLGAAEDCWACDHYPGAIQDIDKPGTMGLCDKCSALLEAGAQVVRTDDAAAAKAGQ